MAAAYLSLLKRTGHELNLVTVVPLLDGTLIQPPVAQSSPTLAVEILTSLLNKQTGKDEVNQRGAIDKASHLSQGILASSTVTPNQQEGNHSLLQSAALTPLQHTPCCPNAHLRLAGNQGRTSAIFLSTSSEAPIGNQMYQESGLQKKLPVPLVMQKTKQAPSDLDEECGEQVASTDCYTSKSEASDGAGEDSSTSSLSSLPCMIKKLQSLGKFLRAPTEPYVDIMHLLNRHNHDISQLVRPRVKRGGYEKLFTESLHDLLSVEDHADTVSYLTHGRAFLVHDVKKFQKRIMPRFFRYNKWTSFCRQLSLYGFRRIQSGPDVGAYYHELFIRGRPELASFIRRAGIPGKEDRRKWRAQMKNRTDPDFSRMPSIDQLGQVIGGCHV